jgi:hypothetical protein
MALERFRRDIYLLGDFPQCYAITFDDSASQQHPEAVGRAMSDVLGHIRRGPPPVVNYVTNPIGFDVLESALAVCQYYPTRPLPSVRRLLAPTPSKQMLRANL